jgi:hypothetical protein
VPYNSTQAKVTAGCYLHNPQRTIKTRRSPAASKLSDRDTTLKIGAAADLDAVADAEGVEVEDVFCTVPVGVAPSTVARPGSDAN